MLNSDMELKNKHNVVIQKRYNAMEIITTIDDQWDMLKESVVQASQTYIPKLERKKHKEWMTEDILQLIDARRKKKESAEEYSILTKVIKSMCDKAKEELLNHMCKEIEANRNTTRAMHTLLSVSCFAICVELCYAP
jgi:hypothetical protein